LYFVLLIPLLWSIWSFKLLSPLWLGGTAVSLLTRLEMQSEGDCWGQSNASIDVCTLQHIWHKIANKIFHIFLDRRKQIQLHWLKKSAMCLCAQSLYFAILMAFWWNSTPFCPKKLCSSSNIGRVMLVPFSYMQSIYKI
jgi:hypothetical protein